MNTIPIELEAHRREADNLEVPQTAAELAKQSNKLVGLEVSNLYPETQRHLKKRGLTEEIETQKDKLLADWGIGPDDLSVEERRLFDVLGENWDKIEAEQIKADLEQDQYWSGSIPTDQIRAEGLEFLLTVSLELAETGELDRSEKDLDDEEYLVAVDSIQAGPVRMEQILRDRAQETFVPPGTRHPDRRGRLNAANDIIQGFGLQERQLFDLAIGLGDSDTARDTLTAVENSGFWNQSPNNREQATNRRQLVDLLRFRVWLDYHHALRNSLTQKEYDGLLLTAEEEFKTSLGTNELTIFEEYQAIEWGEKPTSWPTDIFAELTQRRLNSVFNTPAGQRYLNLRSLFNIPARYSVRAYLDHFRTQDQASLQLRVKSAFEVPRSLDERQTANKKSIGMACLRLNQDDNRLLTRETVADGLLENLAEIASDLQQVKVLIRHYSWQREGLSPLEGDVFASFFDEEGEIKRGQELIDALRQIVFADEASQEEAESSDFIQEIINLRDEISDLESRPNAQIITPDWFNGVDLLEEMMTEAGIDISSFYSDSSWKTLEGTPLMMMMAEKVEDLRRVEQASHALSWASGLTRLMKRSALRIWGVIRRRDFLTQESEVSTKDWDLGLILGRGLEIRRYRWAANLVKQAIEASTSGVSWDEAEGVQLAAFGANDELSQEINSALMAAQQYAWEGVAVTRQDGSVEWLDVTDLTLTFRDLELTGRVNRAYDLLRHHAESAGDWDPLKREVSELLTDEVTTEIMRDPRIAKILQQTFFYRQRDPLTGQVGRIDLKTGELRKISDRQLWDEAQEQMKEQGIDPVAGLRALKFAFVVHMGIDWYMNKYWNTAKNYAMEEAVALGILPIAEGSRNQNLALAQQEGGDWQRIMDHWVGETLSDDERENLWRDLQALTLQTGFTLGFQDMLGRDLQQYPMPRIIENMVLRMGMSYVTFGRWDRDRGAVFLRGVDRRDKPAEEIDPRAFKAYAEIVKYWGLPEEALQLYGADMRSFINVEALTGIKVDAQTVQQSFEREALRRPQNEWASLGWATLLRKRGQSNKLGIYGGTFEPFHGENGRHRRFFARELSRNHGRRLEVVGLQATRAATEQALRDIYTLGPDGEGTLVLHLAMDERAKKVARKPGEDLNLNDLSRLTSFDSTQQNKIAEILGVATFNDVDPVLAERLLNAVKLELLLEISPDIFGYTRELRTLSPEETCRSAGQTYYELQYTKGLYALLLSFFSGKKLIIGDRTKENAVKRKDFLDTCRHIGQDDNGFQIWLAAATSAHLSRFRNFLADLRKGDFKALSHDVIEKRFDEEGWFLDVVPPACRILGNYSRRGKDIMAYHEQREALTRKWRAIIHVARDFEELAYVMEAGGLEPDSAQKFISEEQRFYFAVPTYSRESQDRAAQSDNPFWTLMREQPTDYLTWGDRGYIEARRFLRSVALGDADTLTLLFLREEMESSTGEKLDALGNLLRKWPEFARLAEREIQHRMPLMNMQVEARREVDILRGRQSPEWGWVVSTDNEGKVHLPAYLTSLAGFVGRLSHYVPSSLWAAADRWWGVDLEQAGNLTNDFYQPAARVIAEIETRLQAQADSQGRISIRTLPPDLKEAFSFLNRLGYSSTNREQWLESLNNGMFLDSLVGLNTQALDFLWKRLELSGSPAGQAQRAFEDLQRINHFRTEFLLSGYRQNVVDGRQHWTLADPEAVVGPGHAIYLGWFCYSIGDRDHFDAAVIERDEMPVINCWRLLRRDVSPWADYSPDDPDWKESLAKGWTREDPTPSWWGEAPLPPDWEVSRGGNRQQRLLNMRQVLRQEKWTDPVYGCEVDHSPEDVNRLVREVWQRQLGKNLLNLLESGRLSESINQIADLSGEELEILARDDHEFSLWQATEAHRLGARGRVISEVRLLLGQLALNSSGIAKKITSLNRFYHGEDYDYHGAYQQLVAGLVADVDNPTNNRDSLRFVSYLTGLTLGVPEYLWSSIRSMDDYHQILDVVAGGWRRGGVEVDLQGRRIQVFDDIPLDIGLGGITFTDGQKEAWAWLATRADFLTRLDRKVEDEATVVAGLGLLGRMWWLWGDEFSDLQRLHFEEAKLANPLLVVSESAMDKIRADLAKARDVNSPFFHWQALNKFFWFHPLHPELETKHFQTVLKELELKQANLQTSLNTELARREPKWWLSLPATTVKGILTGLNSLFGGKNKDIQDKINYLNWGMPPKDVAMATAVAGVVVAGTATAATVILGQPLLFSVDFLGLGNIFGNIAFGFTSGVGGIITAVSSWQLINTAVAPIVHAVRHRRSGRRILRPDLILDAKDRYTK